VSFYCNENGPCSKDNLQLRRYRETGRFFLELFENPTLRHFECFLVYEKAQLAINFIGLSKMDILTLLLLFEELLSP